MTVTYCKNFKENFLLRYYGCGLVAPEALEAATILDLGSGAGQDCFILAKLTGQNGHVIGLDMTQELVSCSTRNDSACISIPSRTDSLNQLILLGRMHVYMSLHV